MIEMKKTVEIRKHSRKETRKMKIMRDVQEFLQRDDNCRLLLGKADAVNVGRMKQKTCFK